jgi:putative protein-disulfide isomerase
VTETQRPSLHYFQDTLCGWCYGFGPVIDRLATTWSDVFDVFVYAGGMVTGDRVGTLKDKFPYIETAYRTVEERTGIRFGDAFVNDVLARGELVLESATPARALVTMRLLRPEMAVGFAHRLQQALYRDGQDLASDDVYRALAVEYDLDPERFVSILRSDEIGTAATDEFAYVADLGITGFPTLVLALNDEAHVIAHGFAPFDEIDALLTATFPRA